MLKKVHKGATDSKGEPKRSDSRENGSSKYTSGNNENRARRKEK